MTSSLGDLYAPRGELSTGWFSLAAGAGDIDALRGYYWQGHELIVYMGDPLGVGGAGGDFSSVLVGRIARAWWSADIFNVSLRDARWPLQKNIQTTAYAGTGGIEGGADLKNVLKPLGFGVVRNAEPIVTDQTNLIMQVHERAINSITGVFDRGVELTAAAGDAASYSALTSWTPVAGQYKTYLAGGMLRLGALPDAPVTVDFTGDNTGGYVTGGADLVKRIITWKAPTLTVNATAFSTVQSSRPWNCGLYLRNGEGTIQEACQALAASIGAWTDITPIGDVGEMTIGIIAFGTPVLTLNETVTRNFQAIETPPPPSKVRIGFQRSYLVQKL